jgi:long-chain acyl-CoA synthetase
VLNLSVFLEASARSHPDRDAVVVGDLRLTYAQVNGFANQIANLLVSRGIQPGDKVAISCPNLRTSRSSTTASSRPVRPSFR